MGSFLFLSGVGALRFCVYEDDDAYQIAAGNAGWRFQFRFAVHTGWSRVPELWMFDVMKRLCTYNSVVAIAFVLLWILLVFVEVKIRLYWFLSYIFFGSLPLVFVSFFFASWLALRLNSEYPAGIAGLLSLVLTPLFIFVGVTLVTNFKLTIGGHL